MGPPGRQQHGDPGVGERGHSLREELHQRGIAEANKQLTGKTGGEVNKFFTTDVEAEAFNKKSIETLPKTIGTFDEAAAFSLNVGLIAIGD